MIDKTIVTELNLERYMGTWYEIARFDHRFERGLVGVTATYSLSKNGKIKVINSGYEGTLNGPLSQAVGKAKIPNRKVPGKLKVSFFWIFYGNYFILDLDEDYEWAIIGSSSDKYLWILARSPHISEDLYQNLVNRIRKRGYNPDKLIRVEQNVVRGVNGK